MIKANASKKRSYSRSNNYSSDSDSGSYISSDSDLEEQREPTKGKEVNNLYHIIPDNINKDNNQHNYTIENKPKFDNTFILSRSTKDPLPVLNFSLR